MKGVSTETISYLEMQLLQIEGITEVLKHKNTVSEVWYSIMTTGSHNRQTQHQTA